MNPSTPNSNCSKMRQLGVYCWQPYTYRLLHYRCRHTWSLDEAESLTLVTRWTKQLKTQWVEDWNAVSNSTTLSPRVSMLGWFIKIPSGEFWMPDHETAPLSMVRRLMWLFSRMEIGFGSATPSLSLSTIRSARTSLLNESTFRMTSGETKSAVRRMVLRLACPHFFPFEKPVGRRIYPICTNSPSDAFR